MASVCAWGEVISPLYVGNLVPVLDQNGQPMVGSNRSADAAKRSRVEVRMAGAGSIRPPATDGRADPDNPLVTPDSVGGIGMNTTTTHSGLFCMVFPNRLPPGTRIFARAFNAPTIEEATFYADTKLVVAPGAGKTSLVLTFGEAQPLDPGDADGDGLNNSWERALGTDGRLTSDYDGDGMTDLEEVQAGTSPTEKNSLLVIQSIQKDSSVERKSADGTAAQILRIRFQAVPGKSYQLQFSPFFSEQAFAPVGNVVTAGEGETEIEMPAEVPAERTTGLFRVVLVSGQ